MKQYPTWLPGAFDKFVDDYPTYCAHVINYDEALKIQKALYEMTARKVDFEAAFIHTRTLVETVEILSGFKNPKTLAFLFSVLWPEQFGITLNDRKN